METTICLFDIDGVLVQPAGYRAAVKATMDYFLDQLGFQQEMYGEEIAVLFESLGVTSEWDMMPISLAIVLDAAFAAQPPAEALSSLEAVLAWGQEGRTDVQVDMRKAIKALAPRFMNAEIPAEALLRSLEVDRKGALSHLSLELLEEMLGNTRSVEKSVITRISQNIILGNEDFEAVYGLAPLFFGESYLKTRDRLMLEPGLYQQIRAAKQAGGFYYAAYTARPSFPPKEIKTNLLGYSPEAEQALALLDAEPIPLIGYGRLNYLAEQMNSKPDAILKPAPLQALAALAAAVTGTEYPSLLWALETYSRSSAGKVQPLDVEGAQDVANQLPRKFSLHVFEDSSVGITAGHKAAAILNQDGYEVEFHAWGVATEEDKKAALAQVGAQIFPTVNEAVRAALNLD
ncbi:MAG: hypothetical protein RBT34_14790 [Anaerolineaceae bacterium]|nr:hypothetical protein [Anaerolineaceae bacterium]